MDRFNGHRVLLIMGILTVAGLALAPLSPLLALLALLFGLSASAFSPPCLRCATTPW